MTRLTRDLCQSCYEDLHPDDYAPIANRMSLCDACGFHALVTRSTIADERLDESIGGRSRWYMTTNGPRQMDERDR